MLILVQSYICLGRTRSGKSKDFHNFEACPPAFLKMFLWPLHATKIYLMLKNYESKLNS